MMLTKGEAAERLGVCTRTVDRLIKKGAIPFYRIGPKTTRIDSGDLEAYLAAVRFQRTAAPPTMGPRLVWKPGMKVV